jgi:molybdate/tungstate transport system substrate-binding protein
MHRLCALLILAVAGLSAEDVSGTLRIFHAGSLSVPMQELGAAFGALHPGIDFRMEAAGSRACARKLTELDQVCDVLAAADYLVIDQLLIPDHATWNLKFATNEMCIVSTAASRRAGGLTATNWPEILLDPGIAFGRADPDQDPCGYRAVLTIQLTERLLGRAGLAAQLLAKDRQHIRPKETDLLALLESHSLDYIFLYRSVAEQHGLKRLLLPDEVNLKRPELAAHYATAAVELSGKNPGEKIVQLGEPMVYGVTVPTRAPNPAAARAFVAFMLSPAGLAIIERLGQPPCVPAVCETFDSLPAELRVFARAPAAKAD